jgi:hypothetical protein
MVYRNLRVLDNWLELLSIQRFLQLCSARDSEAQRFHLGLRVFLCSAVDESSWELWNFSYPASVVFLFELNVKIHDRALVGVSNYAQLKRN